MFQRALISGCLFLCLALNPANAQENADGLTFREIHFGALMDGVLDGPQHVVVSPDGRDVYVSSRTNDSIVHFRREPDGTLELSSTLQVQPDPQAAVFNVGTLAIHQNGRFIYVEVDLDINGDFIRGLARLDRNSTTGALAFGEVIFPVFNEECDAFSVVISPDGEFVYVLCILPPTRQVIVGVAIDPNSGTMSVVQTLDRMIGSGLSFVLPWIQMAISPDGNNAYVASPSQQGIEIFDIADTGELSFEQFVPTIRSNTSTPQSVVVSPDGAHVYVADTMGNAILTLQRDDSGDLSLPEAGRGVPEGVLPLPAVTRVVLSPSGDKLFALSFGTFGGAQTHVSALSRNPKSGALTLLETVMDGITGTAVIIGNNWPTISPDGETFYLPAAETDALAVFASTRPALPCEIFPEISTAFAEMQSAYALPEDVNEDGLPESAVLALLEQSSCNPFDDGLDEATANAYLINLSTTNWEVAVEDTGEWIPYQSTLASLLLTSAAMQTYLNDALEPFEHSLEQIYLAATCTDDGCEPSAARAADEPFSGEGDPDDDGFTNAEEWANVLARGGDEREFAVSALDPANDGSISVSSSGGGGGCFIATAAYGTPLAAELDTLRAFRDQHLLTNPLGTAFADVYYRLSPPAATLIAERPLWRASAQIALQEIFSGRANALAAGIVVALIGWSAITLRRRHF